MGSTKPNDESPPISAKRTTPPGRWLVLFDGRCGFCRRRAATLARLGRLDAESMGNFHDAGVLDALPGVSPQACQAAMHVITPQGRVFAGPEGIVRVLVGRRAWGALAWLYYVPGIRQICNLAYRWVARHRYELSAARGDRPKHQ